MNRIRLSTMRAFSSSSGTELSAFSKPQRETFLKQQAAAIADPSISAQQKTMIDRILFSPVANTESHKINKKQTKTKKKTFQQFRPKPKRPIIGGGKNREQTWNDAARVQCLESGSVAELVSCVSTDMVRFL